MTLKKPHHTRSFKGEPRRIGYEYEFAGLAIDECISIIQTLFGGNVEQDHSLEATLCDTRIGTVRIELDSSALKKVAKHLEIGMPAADESNETINELLKRASSVMGVAAREIIPIEIVTDPLTVEQSYQLVALEDALRNEGAQGTRASTLYAFGLHINPEISAEDPITSLNMLRAFILLYPWLKSEMRLDVSRRVTAFIDPFPKDYAKHILRSDYAPDWQKLATDYVAHNPTRNRALDMLPLFAQMCPETLEPLPDAMRAAVKARPTYHYRLPNCDIDNPQWSAALEWQRWLVIEQVAHLLPDTPNLMKDYQQQLDHPLQALSDRWVKHMEDWLKQHDIQT